MRTVIFIQLLALAIISQGFSYDFSTATVGLYPTRMGPQAICGNLVAQQNHVIRIGFVDKQDRFKNEFEYFDLGDSNLTDMTVRGDTIIATSKTFFQRYSMKKQSSLEMTVLPISYARSLSVSGGDAVVAGSGGLVKMKAGSTEKEVFFKDKILQKTVIRPNGEVVVLSSGSFIGVLKNGVVTIHERNTDSMGTPHDIALDPVTGTVFASTIKGIFAYSGNTWDEVYTYSEPAQAIMGTMIVDGYGIIWGCSVPAEEINICRYDIAKKEFASEEKSKNFSWIEKTSGGLPLPFGLDSLGRLLIVNNGWMTYVTDNSSPVIYIPTISRPGEAISFNSRGFTISRNSHLSLEAFTISGRLINKSSGYFEAGNHNFSSLLKGVSGPVFIRTNIGGKVESRKVTILR